MYAVFCPPEERFSAVVTDLGPWAEGFYVKVVEAPETFRRVVENVSVDVGQANVRHVIAGSAVVGATWVRVRRDDSLPRRARVGSLPFDSWVWSGCRFQGAAAAGKCRVLVPDGLSVAIGIFRFGVA